MQSETADLTPDAAGQFWDCLVHWKASRSLWCGVRSKRHNSLLNNGMRARCHSTSSPVKTVPSRAMLPFVNIIWPLVFDGKKPISRALRPLRVYWTARIPRSHDATVRCRCCARRSELALSSWWCAWRPPAPRYLSSSTPSAVSYQWRTRRRSSAVFRRLSDARPATRSGTSTPTRRCSRSSRSYCWPSSTLCSSTPYWSPRDNAKRWLRPAVSAWSPGQRPQQQQQVTSAVAMNDSAVVNNASRYHHHLHLHLHHHHHLLLFLLLLHFLKWWDRCNLEFTAHKMSQNVSDMANDYPHFPRWIMQPESVQFPTQQFLSRPIPSMQLSSHPLPSQQTHLHPLIILATFIRSSDIFANEMNCGTKRKLQGNNNHRNVNEIVTISSTEN